MRPPLTTVQIQRVGPGATRAGRSDQVVTEEPLAIAVDGRPFQVTLRTPGADEQLIAGLLFAEGVIDFPDDLLGIEPQVDAEAPDFGNAYNVLLRPEAPGLSRIASRTQLVNSACGVCGKTIIDTLGGSLPPIEDAIHIPWRLVAALPDQLRAQQPLFTSTGGIHAAGLFTGEGTLLTLAEDVGRHNAVDKVIGQLVLEGFAALPHSILQISGRAGYEILQKAWRAQIPIVVAVGAPSSLAIEVAERAGITLVAFLRGEQGNVYTHPARIDV